MHHERLKYVRAETVPQIRGSARRIFSIGSGFFAHKFGLMHDVRTDDYLILMLFKIRQSIRH